MAKKDEKEKKSKKSTGWDPDKHEVLASKRIKVSDKQRVVVEVYSYDGGENKVGIKSLITKANGEEVFAPFKSMSIATARKVGKAITKVIEESGVDG